VLSFFRRNLFINLIFLLLFVIALQAYFFFHWSPPEFRISLDIFNKQFFPALLDNHIIQTIVTILLIFGQAVLVGRYVIQNKLSRALSLIPAAVFALFASFIIEDRSFDAVLVANLFFVLSIGSLYEIYKKYQPVTAIFNSGAFMAIASIIYFPYCIFLLVLFLGLISLRNINVKEVLQLVIGFAMPYFFVTVYLYYNDNLQNLSLLLSENSTFPAFGFDDLEMNIKLIGALIIVALSLLFQNDLKKKKKFDAIKKVELCYWMLFLSVFSIMLVDELTYRHLIILSFPVSILMGLLLERKDGGIIKEFVFLLCIVLYFLCVLNFV
jgi:hypothetical protein